MLWISIITFVMFYRIIYKKMYIYMYYNIIKQLIKANDVTKSSTLLNDVCSLEIGVILIF